MVKIVFFHAVLAANIDGGRAQPAVEKFDMKRQGGRTVTSTRLRCRARRRHATGLFRHFVMYRKERPIYRKEGKQTQPVSFVEKAGISGPSAYGLHMAEFAPECKGPHVAAQ
ncbi:hypothetical protein X736_11485 [Mesorhizobium sp. L2C089B000]|nr:hypothetical protein X767_20720 [Mesorhizobium sp. LSJC264A00]ESX57842.1 hypothetical protein X761_06545 [Mesorhizobium sp. LSHC424B00]ESZ07200.1 hypothetical protein X736_11485 [Mesorhizobium sp. L2C089B000]